MKNYSTENAREDYTCPGCGDYIYRGEVCLVDEKHEIITCSKNCLQLAVEQNDIRERQHGKLFYTEEIL